MDLASWDDPAAVMMPIMKMTIDSTPTAGVSGELMAMIMKYG
jgi:hypothetical protein